MRLALSLILLCATAGAATVPRPSQEFVIKSGAREALLSQFRGKVVLLVFIHTTCPHCQQSIGSLNEIQRDYGARGLQILAAAFNEMAAQLIPGFMTQFRPAFPVGYTSRESVNEYLQIPQSTPFRIPVYVFIDKKRVIRAVHMADEPFLREGPKNTRALIETLLKEPAPPKQ